MDRQQKKTFRSTSPVQVQAPSPPGHRPRLFDRLHERDLRGRWGRVQMPTALNRKHAKAPSKWSYQCLSPQQNWQLHPEEIGNYPLFYLG
jgi:hypothetical protein